MLWTTTLPRQATTDDLAWVKPMADRHKPAIGFVVRGALVAAIARGELLVVEGAGFCHYHRRRDGWTTVYEIVSEAPGTGRALLETLHRPVRLKCPVTLPANGFYAHLGLVRVATEAGKARALNVWQWT